MYDYFIPNWVTILFLIFIHFPIIMVALLAKKGAPIHKKNTVFFTILLFFTIYISYVTFCEHKKLFTKEFLPPIILIYTTFPLKIFLFTVILNLTIYKTILNNLKIEDLVKVHLFRLIGVFFILLAYYKALPKTFALIAGFGDVITALSSIYIAQILIHKKPWAKKATFIWNTFGLIDILFTAISAIVITKIAIDTNAMGVDALAEFPFCYIPAIAPPTIIFLHISIYKKLKQF